MVTWQNDLGTLSFLSERGNFGTWELPSASDCASDFVSEYASASSTQSLNLSVKLSYPITNSSC